MKAACPGGGERKTIDSVFSANGAGTRVLDGVKNYRQRIFGKWRQDACSVEREKS